MLCRTLAVCYRLVTNISPSIRYKETEPPTAAMYKTDRSQPEHRAMKSHRECSVAGRFLVTLVAVVLFARAAGAQDDQAQAAQQRPANVMPFVADNLDPKKVKVTDVSLQGRIEGRNITFALELTATTKKRDVVIALVRGDVVLDDIAKKTKDYKLRYDPHTITYYMKWPRPGEHEVAISFAARPVPVAQRTQWRQAVFSIPSSRVRKLEVTADRTDLEILFPGALRVTRKVENDELTITAILGPGRPFAVLWKPQVAELDAKLVLTGEANTIATVGAGVLRLDTLFAFDIAQGKLTELTFTVPSTLSVTQVRGRHIRDWRIKADDDANAQKLTVILNRPQAQTYGLQILSEMTLPTFPAEIDLPAIEPEEVRTGGHLAIGTGSAIQLVVNKTSSLSQVDASAFPRILLDREHPRRPPTGKAFYYAYAALPYQMNLSMSDIVPSYDASERLVINVREDDLIVEAQIELDVRDAPIRSLVVEVPAGFAVADVSGTEVERDDYSVRETAEKEGVQEVEIHFRRPVLGRTLVAMRLELGKGPLDNEEKIGGFSVQGAKNERGYLVVVAEEGVQLDEPTFAELREVHTGSVPMQVADAQYAYRFRNAGWSLALTAHKMPSSVRVEAFHLVSLGEGVMYGSVAVSYFISGAPTDELHFRLPPGLKDVEFVGRDVSRWDQEGDRRTVKLQRKIIGDYNLAVTYSRRYEDGGAILVGGIECDVETQTGYMVIASHLNVKLTPEERPDRNLLEVKREEVPAHYRLLVTAPILRTYKYVAAPHRVSLTVDAYDRASLLPGVVEVMDLRTLVGVREDGEIESVTTIRYKVKNSSIQFLTLATPKEARVWSTHIIEKQNNGAEKRVRVTASIDRKTGLLMVPLPRYRNPNEPATIELEYGQAHKTLGWSGALRLAAPTSGVRSTFASWRVTVPKDWAVLPDRSRGANMIPTQQDLKQGDLSLLVKSVLVDWRWALVRGIDSRLRYAGLGVLFVIIILAVVLRRSGGLRALPIALLLALVIVGVFATRAPSFAAQCLPRGQVETMTFTQVLSTDSESPLTVSAFVVPAWRRNVTFTGVILIPLAALACFVLASLMRRLRRLGRAFVALGVAALAYAAAQFSILALPLSHFFTWGAPALVMLWLIGQVLLHRRSYEPAPVPIAAALMLICAVLMSGCAARPDILPIRNNFVLDRVDCKLTAEKDSMQVEFDLKLNADDPMRFPLMHNTAILLPPEPPERLPKHISVREEGGKYFLEVWKAGKYAVDLKFLSSLPEAGDDQLRRFLLPVPMALMNEIELEIPEPGMEVASPNAIRLTQEEAEESTLARVILGPGDDAVFVWKPRARQIEREETSFFSEAISVMRFDSGLVEGRHRIHFQIAQGELKEIRIKVPDNMTVTAVEGAELGAWRFDPAGHALEARLSTPARDEYVLTVVTQISPEGTPYGAIVARLEVEGAASHRGTLGMAASPSVYVTVVEHPQVMNVDDFTRGAAALLDSWPAVNAADIRHAYRVHSPEDTLNVGVNEVQPELRTRENSIFTIADDRLVYNGELTVEIAKAGVFSVDVMIPGGYDIDALGAPEVSHWDESEGEGDHTVQVHFRNRLLGQAALRLTLSRPEVELPREIRVPRVSVVGELKHTGQIVISSDRGVRLLVTGRLGVSELNPLEQGIRKQGTLAFKLLKPDWELILQTEVLKPRINVEFLHVAKVTEGLVRHTHYLRYKLHNAGAKVFEFAVPEEAISPQITGPDIARREEVEAGRWRVELAHKWFDRPYPLKITYETRFDRGAGRARVQSARALGADFQRGHVVVYATDRVELSPQAVGPSLESHDARSLPRTFGAGDLSEAAFCYRTSTADWELSFEATRHDAAALLEADVLSTRIITVVNEFGESINQVNMQLRVSGKRHLETTLPPGAEVWSLLVNRRSTEPSRRKGSDAREVLLVPLAQAAAGELPVDVELIYAVSGPKAWTLSGQVFVGPQFDLPLKDVSWQLYLPETFVYYDFAGTLNVNKDVVDAKWIQYYDINVYEAKVQRANEEDLQKAKRFQDAANILAQKGEQYQARQAFESAYNYSFSDAALNEDARVQLKGLIRQQAMVGLLGNRLRLRRQDAQPEGKMPAQSVTDLGDKFNRDDAERLRGSLSKADSENLDVISNRMIEMQEAAAGTGVQLIISTPLKGRLLQFDRPLQVKPNTQMMVSFAAKPASAPRATMNWTYAAGLCLIVFLVLSAAPPIWRTCSVRRERSADSAPSRQQPMTEPTPETPDDVEDDQAGDDDLPDEEGPEEQFDEPTDDDAPAP